MKVPDFSACQNGVLVRRSLHWFVEHAVPKFSPKRDQLGIVVGLEFHEDRRRQLVAYPVVHWEGERAGSVTHPANVRHYRRDQKFRRVEIEE